MKMVSYLFRHTLLCTNDFNENEPPGCKVLLIICSNLFHYVFLLIIYCIYTRSAHIFLICQFVYVMNNNIEC